LQSQINTVISIEMFSSKCERAYTMDPFGPKRVNKKLTTFYFFIN